MGKNSEIEWTDHTFNPWWGCVKISPACAHCYAETWAKRVGASVWGSRAARRFFGERHWEEPLEWDHRAASARRRQRVFCASMADVFERRAELNSWRSKLWDLIVNTPNLDWLLLTKRPHNIATMVPWDDNWPPNLWLGTTVENTQAAHKRLPHLLKHPAAVRFLSCEPLLGPLDLSPWAQSKPRRSIDWVIAGGESGPAARPTHPDWLRDLRDFCANHSIAFHFKQWGHWIPAEMRGSRPGSLKTKKIGTNQRFVEMVAVGKKEAGRILDGITYDEFPADKFAT